jgi:hypothetical protein
LSSYLQAHKSWLKKTSQKKEYNESHHSELTADDFNSPTVIASYHKRQRLQNQYAWTRQAKKDAKLLMTAELRVKSADRIHQR